jgi:hypothetical protein
MSPKRALDSLSRRSSPIEPSPPSRRSSPWRECEVGASNRSRNGLRDREGWPCGTGSTTITGVAEAVVPSDMVPAAEEGGGGGGGDGDGSGLLFSMVGRDRLAARAGATSDFASSSLVTADRPARPRVQEAGGFADRFADRVSIALLEVSPVGF